MVYKPSKVELFPSMSSELSKPNQINMTIVNVNLEAFGDNDTQLSKPHHSIQLSDDFASITVHTGYRP